MFKLESYITPILLSYVEKYVKDVKAERSQVCETKTQTLLLLFISENSIKKLDCRPVSTKNLLELQSLGLNFPSVSRAGISLGWRRRVLQPGPSTGRFGTRAGSTILICVGPYSRASNPRPMDQAEC